MIGIIYLLNLTIFYFIKDYCDPALRGSTHYDCPIPTPNLVSS